MAQLRNLSFAAAAAATLMLFAGTANAATLVEDFEAAPFGVWESNWFGANSNAENFYVTEVAHPDHDNRGYNLDGLFLTDGDGDDGQIINIVFDAVFGASLTSLSIDVASYLRFGTLDFFDINGAIIATLLVIPTEGAHTDPGLYNTYSVTSTNGIGGFRFNNGEYEAEGNISVDNIVATTAVTSVPLPAALPLLASGFGAMGMLGWRRRRTAAAAT